MEDLYSTKDREPVWEHNYDYWLYPSTKNLFSRGVASTRSLFNKRSKAYKSRSKTYMSRTGKRGVGSLTDGPGQMMRRGKIDGGQEWITRMGKRDGGSNESMTNFMVWIENIMNISRIGKKDGQKHFMIRRGGHNTIMTRESNRDRMMKRDSLWGRIL